jgi:hypothetical protein
VLEIGHVQHRHPEQLELGVLVGDGGGLLVVNDARRADAPQRRLARVVLARRELRLLILVDVAFTAARPLRGDARVVLRYDAERLHEGVAEIVERLEAIRPRDAAVGILELGVALGRQGVGALVVDHLVGGQDVVVVIDLDVALRDHAIAARVIDQLIGLQVERLGAVNFRLRTEHAAGLLGKGLGGRLDDLAGRVLGEGNLGENDNGPEQQDQGSRRRGRAHTHPMRSVITTSAGRRFAAHIVRYRRSTHHSAVLLV